jgi:uncharacterized membrane protein
MSELMSFVIIALALCPACMRTPKSVMVAFGAYLLATPLMLAAMAWAVTSTKVIGHGPATAKVVAAVLAVVIAVAVLVVGAVWRLWCLKRSDKTLKGGVR